MKKPNFKFNWVQTENICPHCNQPVEIKVKSDLQKGTIVERPEKCPIALQLDAEEAAMEVKQK